MKGTPRLTRGGNPSDTLAMLVRSIPVRLVEVSRGGCRLECSRRVESGTSGVLTVEMAGLLRIDDIRVARCQARVGAGQVFQVGAELLRTRRLGRRTIRMAVGVIIHGTRSAAAAAPRGDVGLPGEIRPGEVNGRSDGRAPPDMPDRGS